MSCNQEANLSLVQAASQIQANHPQNDEEQREDLDEGEQNSPDKIDSAHMVTASSLRFAAQGNVVLLLWDRDKALWRPAQPVPQRPACGH